MPLRQLDWVRTNRVAVTLGAVLATAGVRYLLTPWLGNDSPFLLFTLPVLALAILAGPQPAIAAMAISLVVGTYFASIGNTIQSNILQAVLFLIVASSIVWLATRFRRSHEQLAAADEHLRSILDTVPDAMVVVGADNRIISFSPAAERMFSTLEAAVIGKPFPALLRDSASPAVASAKHIAHFRASGDPQLFGMPSAVQAVRADGVVFPAELSVGETMAAGQRLFTGFIRDLSTQKAAAQRISRLQAQLDQVGRMGAMGTMASTLAHELNQPITAVAAYLRAARIQLDAVTSPFEVAAILESAEAEAMRAGEIIHHLRAYVTRGEVEQAAESLPILIREAMALTNADGRNNGVEMVQAFDPATPPVRVNRVQLQQVLVNLIRNAVEAMEPLADKRLTLATTPDGHDHALVTITDTGPGLAPEVADHVFEAFTTTKQRGLGLGLPISRTITEANGGRIWVTPAPAGGTTFHIRLPSASTPPALTPSSLLPQRRQSDAVNHDGNPTRDR